MDTLLALRTGVKLLMMGRNFTVQSFGVRLGSRRISVASGVVLWSCLLGLGTVGSTLRAQASDLIPSSTAQQIEIFRRCHFQLSRQPVRRSDLTTPGTLAYQVRQGTKTGVSACAEILNGVSLESRPAQPNYGMLTSNTETNRAVLNTLFRLFKSWTGATDFRGEYTDLPEIAHAAYDTNAFALYHTYAALFGNNPRWDQIVKLNTSLWALRSTPSDSLLNPPVPVVPPAFTPAPLAVNYPAPTVTPTPTGTTTPILLTSGAALSGVQVGTLVGIAPMDPARAGLQIRGPNDNRGGGITVSYFPFHPYPGSAGGVLGDAGYLLNWSGMPGPFIPLTDGGTKVWRRLSKRIYDELLCKDNRAPIRTSDAVNFVNSNPGANTPPFRSAASCMSCHTSYDSSGGVYRNLTLSNATGIGGACTEAGCLPILGTITIDRGRLPGMVDSTTNYSRSLPDGALIFRAHDGTWVNRPIQAGSVSEGVTKLGAALADTNEMYLCTVSRLYEYFTGISVNLRDEGDPTSTPLSASERQHRDVIRGIAGRLKSNQNIKESIIEIFGTDAYNQRNP